MNSSNPSGSRRLWLFVLVYPLHILEEIRGVGAFRVIKLWLKKFSAVIASLMKTKPRTGLLAGLAIFVLTCSIFILSHNRQIADSKYSMLVSESLLHHGSFTLDRYGFEDFGKQNSGGWGGIYQL